MDDAKGDGVKIIIGDYIIIKCRRNIKRSRGGGCAYVWFLTLIHNSVLERYLSSSKVSQQTSIIQGHPFGVTA